MTCDESCRVSVTELLGLPEQPETLLPAAWLLLSGDAQGENPASLLSAYWANA